MNCESNAETIAKRLQEAGLYTKRFGSFAKADYETLMFTIYLDMLDKPARDYDISLDLGITESKVRSLRIRSQLLYPRVIEWKKELEVALKHGYYNKNDQTVTLIFENPSVLNLIRNIVETEHGNVFLSLNQKQLCLPLEDLLLLASKAGNTSNDSLETLNEVWQHTQNNAERITKERLTKRIWNKHTDVFDIINVFSAALTVWPVASPIIENVLQLIRG